MIPLRVYLKNFLCHREQEFVFDGPPVWLLHGPNGVGKSAVFDAMVYALFGQPNRREGSRTAVADLVRYGESSMRVEFDFEYRGRRYRVWRTRTRNGQPRQGVGEFRDGSPAPQPLAHVNRASELDQWVCDTLGLNYEAFVSAVLLRQGAAERLIDADRQARRDLFRGIIDLEPYVRLHEAVTEGRTAVGGKVRVLRGALQEMPEVTEDQLTAAVDAHQQTTANWERAGGGGHGPCSARPRPNLGWAERNLRRRSGTARWSPRPARPCRRTGADGQAVAGPARRRPRPDRNDEVANRR
jgi:DNA repair exonuclease SbcCD ATPase subunit